MAVLKQDFLRSTYQQLQLTSIQNIEKILDKSRDDIIDAANYISKNGITADIESIVEELANTLTRSGDATSGMHQRAYSRVFSQIQSDNRDATRERRQSRISDEDRARVELKASQARAESLKRFLTNAFHEIYGFLDEINLSLGKVISNSVRVRYSTNTTVFTTGYTREMAETMRDSVRESVDRLNKMYSGDARGQFDYLESLDLMNSLINQTNIKNAEFYDEFGEMLLRTSKSMDIHLGSLAIFADRFYKRYGFSSATMEKMLGNIQTNTAGSSVSEEEAASFGEANSKYVTDYVYRTGGTADDVVRYNDNILGEYTRLTEMGLGEYRDSIMTMIETASQDFGSSEAKMLRYLGVDTNNLQERFLTDPASVIDKVLEGMSSKGDYLLTGGYAVQGQIVEALSSIGLSSDTAEMWKEVTKRMNMVGLYTEDQYDKDRDKTKVAEDPLAEMFTDKMTRLSNINSTLAEDVADMQEKWGVDLSYIQRIWELLKGIFGGAVSNFASSTFGSFFGSYLGNGGTISGLFNSFLGSGSGVIGSLGTAGAIAAILYTVGATVKGIHDGLAAADENFARASGKTDYDELPELDEGQVYGYGVKSITIDPETGETKEEYGTIAVDGGFDFNSTRRGIAEDIVAEYNKGKLASGQLMISDNEDGMVVHFRANNQYGDIGSAQTFGEVTLDMLGLGGLAGGSFSLPIYGAVKHASEGAGVMEGLWDTSSNLTKILERLSTSEDALPLYTYYQQLGLIPMDQNVDDLKALFALLWDYVYDYAEDNKVLDLRKLSKNTTRGDISEDLYYNNPIDLTPYAIDASLINSRYINPLMEKAVSLEEPDWDLKDISIDASYRVGTPYVPEDQLALLHEGEAVIPKEYNPFNESRSIVSYDSEDPVPVPAVPPTVTTIINPVDKSFYENLSRETSSNAQSNQESPDPNTGLLNTLISRTTEILDFLAIWREDREYQESLQQAKSAVKSAGNVSASAIY